MGRHLDRRKGLEGSFLVGPALRYGQSRLLDPFGDFDLIFGAAKLDLQIVDMPVRCHERIYGQTNIQRRSHGWLLLRMFAFTLLRLKFV